MGLKHEFNRPDEGAGLIERIDAYLTRTADHWAERWQAVTPLSRQGLTLGCYISASLCSLGYVVLTRQVLFLGVAWLAYLGSAPGKQRGSLIEELQLEVTGLPKHTLKYLSVFLFGLGLLGLLSALPELILGAFAGQLAPGGLSSIVGGLAFLFLKCADYIARTNPNHRDGDPEQLIGRVRNGQTAPPDLPLIDADAFVRLCEESGVLVRDEQDCPRLAGRHSRHDRSGVTTPRSADRWHGVRSRCWSCSLSGMGVTRMPRPIGSRGRATSPGRGMSSPCVSI